MYSLPSAVCSYGEAVKELRAVTISALEVNQECKHIYAEVFFHFFFILGSIVTGPKITGVWN